MDKKIVVISFGKRFLLSRILAALFYATAIFLIYNYFVLHKKFVRIHEYIEMRNGFYSIFILLFFAVRFSLNVSFHFNFEEMKYRKFYYVGPIGYGTWKEFKKLDRVSTFLNSRNECEVNIWDIRNNRFEIAIFDEVDHAVLYGRDLAETLKIKFLERK
ncbi:MAG: hypothetical protein WAO74_00790 [Polaribacter sp.]|uniref:hypothetical protein n=1 Tax=Polaribacter sp. TaxID=1920175 RepID=UPI003BB0DD9E